LYPNYLYRVNQWTQILNLLQQSLYAEEMVCAMSSQLFHIPQTKDLKGNREMHNHLVPASYHRVTAAGSAQRLSNGEQQQSIVETMTACIINAENQDKKVRDGLKMMEENASPEFKSFIKVIIQWQTQAETYLNQAKAALQSMGISFPIGSEQQSGEYNVY
jgi:isopenicillin N synthase-like dioxygenase